MHINITGLIAFILSIAGYMLTVKYLAAKPRRKIFPFLIISSILAVPGVSFAIYYFHMTPEMKWYYDFRCLPGVELLTMFIGVAFAAFAVMLPKRYRYLTLVIALLLSAVPYIKPVLFQLRKHKLRENWKDGVCLQTTSSTCGPSSAATIMTRLGFPVTERELAQESYSSATGTEAWYLANALRRRGVEVQFSIMPRLTIPQEFPCIAGVKLSNGVGHFIPILNYDGTQYQIGDPMNGPESLSADELMKRYKFTGFVMHITAVK